MAKYKKPNLTYSLIALCLIVYLVEIYYGLQHGSFGDENFSNSIKSLFYDYGFSIQNILNKPWVLITSTFIHDAPDPSHLLLNMIALFFFGKVIELELGRKKFLLIFVISSIIGDLAVLFLTLIGVMPAVSTIGASAAIFGLMGTAMLVKPFEFIFYPYLIPIPLILVALIYTLYNIAEFLLVLTTITDSNISYISHIAGLAAGMLFGFREEGSRKGFIILLFLLLLLITTPFLWMIFKYLEVFNYVTVLSKIFK
jgi:membrane associated rhomboid family serine protease